MALQLKAPGRSYSILPGDGSTHRCSGGSQPGNMSVSKAKGRVCREEP